MRVYSDEGHGGKDSGAVENGYKEKDIVLDISTSFVRELEAHRVNTKRSRTNDMTVSLNQRCANSNNFKANVFVSHHINSYNNTSNGVEVLYHPGSKEGKKLSQIVLDELMKTGIFKSNRGIKPRPNLAVLRGTSAPAILIEYGFISNKDEINKVVKNINLLGRVAARGVLKYLRIPVKKEEKQLTEKEVLQIIRKETKRIEDSAMQKWQKEAIDFVKEKGFMQGYEDGSFKPNKPVTRAELAQVLYNIYK